MKYGKSGLPIKLEKLILENRFDQNMDDMEQFVYNQLSNEKCKKANEIKIDIRVNGWDTRTLTEKEIEKYLFSLIRKGYVQQLQLEASSFCYVKAK